MGTTLANHGSANVGARRAKLIRDSRLAIEAIEAERRRRRIARRLAIIDKCSQIDLGAALGCGQPGPQRPSPDAWSRMAVAEFLRTTNGHRHRGIGLLCCAMDDELEPVPRRKLRMTHVTETEVRAMREARARGDTFGKISADFAVAWHTARDNAISVSNPSVANRWWSYGDPRPDVEIFRDSVGMTGDEIRLARCARQQFRAGAKP